jgi:hypothetical protein
MPRSKYSKEILQAVKKMKKYSRETSKKPRSLPAVSRDSETNQKHLIENPKVDAVEEEVENLEIMADSSLNTQNQFQEENSKVLALL